MSDFTEVALLAIQAWKTDVVVARGARDNFSATTKLT